MDDLDEDDSFPGFEPLFIREERGDPDKSAEEQSEGDENPSGLSFTESPLKQSALIKPYLQEMDELLKSCEELTGIPFGSRYSAADSETCLGESSCSGDQMESCGGICTHPQAYLSTSYIDTHMDGTEAEDETVQGRSLGNLVNRCEVYQHTEMPLSSAGSKLRANMVEYESQLMGMLAMLESCMEESGMDYEPQDRAADTGQEYVHISKNPHRYGGTRPVQSELCVNGGDASEGSGNGVTVGTAGSESQQHPSPRCQTMSGFLDRRPEEHGHLEADLGSGLQVDHAGQCPVFSEGTKTGRVLGDSTETKRDVDGGELPAEGGHDFSADLGSDTDTLRALGSRVEDCVEEVQQLQKRRKELLAEALRLREEGGTEEGEETAERIDSRVVALMDALKREEEVRREERKREMYRLREERAEEERALWRVSLERQGLQEELRRLKRRLFQVARDCAYSRAALNDQRREVELLRREEEKRNSLLLGLTEESCQLRSAQQQRLLDLRAQLHARGSIQPPSTQEELSACRRLSCGDIQQYLQNGRKALEDRYEPVLLALLKRREATAGALVTTKQQAQELRAQLRPLREQIQKLELERACLDERLQLLALQRREDAGRYKEAVCCLEEHSRRLRTELEVQRRRTKEMEELKESLTEQLLLHRAATEGHNGCNREEKT
ncbi:uncharacterized protein sync [Kryptolebias marmoratus]|uniref:Uncharacterized LOC108238758 n=1 Tax=Kryptolebias marmoratus TaxID=37003 RepID=A0A3Q3BIS8_KRYMA|nr:uncharacterized protein sync [Kryptolebias marmoratus]